MLVFEVKDAELIESVTKQAEAAGVKAGAIVSLIGAADSFALSTMPEDDASADVITEYTVPAELHGTGEIVDGVVHIHATMATAGDVGRSGHLHRADIGHWFARAYVIPSRLASE